MSPRNQALPAQTEEQATPEIIVDNRRSKRLRFNASVRFLTADGAECIGELSDISIGGARVTSAYPVAKGESIVIYIDDVGRFKANVVWSNKFEFGVTFLMPATKQQRLKEALASHIRSTAQIPEDDDKKPGEDRRTADRYNLQENQIVGKTEDGFQFACTVRNISLNGIDILTKVNLETGEIVRIGLVQGVVVRKHEDGYGISFELPDGIRTEP